MGKVCVVCYKARPANNTEISLACPTCGTQNVEERCLICGGVQGVTALTEGGTHVAIEAAWGHVYDDPSLLIDDGDA